MGYGDIRETDHVFTLDEWREAVGMGMFNEYDGSGAWAKDGQYLTGFVFDDVFAPAPEGATHVVWFNK